MGGHVPPEVGRMVAEGLKCGDPRPRIRISYLMAAEMGVDALAGMKDQIRKTVEAETGRPHEWRMLINMDAIELAPAGAND